MPWQSVKAVSELHRDVRQAPAPSLGAVAPDLPREVVAVVDRALAQRKADRYASASEMRVAWNAASDRRADP